MRHGTTWARWRALLSVSQSTTSLSVLVYSVGCSALFRVSANSTSDYWTSRKQNAFNLERSSRVHSYSRWRGWSGRDNFRQRTTGRRRFQRQNHRREYKECSLQHRYSAINYLYTDIWNTYLIYFESINTNPNHKIDVTSDSSSHKKRAYDIDRFNDS